jgi:hypothetical protein
MTLMILEKLLKNKLGIKNLSCASNGFEGY